MSLFTTMSSEHKSDTEGSLNKVDNEKAASEELVDFGGEASLPPPPDLTAEEERKLWRKIDLRLAPILSLMYLLSYLDRANIGNARLQGLESQLELTGNKYNIALTMYFIPYCIFECPANLVLKKIRPSRWLPGITVVWGIVMTMMGLVKTYVCGGCFSLLKTFALRYPQLVGVRICLGVAEAGLFPGVVYYLTLWYPRHMLQWRIALFFGAASCAGAFGGTLAYGISFMSGIRNRLGWSWIFMLEGIATVVVGILAFFVLVDFPVTAEFLTPEERAYVIRRKKYDNSSVGEEEHFEMRHITEALTDWQVWMHMLIYLCMIANLYGITLFLPTIINTFGHSAAVSQLLTVPPYVLATMFIFIFAYYSDKLQKRHPFIIAGFIINLIGFSINISTAPPGVKYFGTFFCVTGAYAAIPSIVAWSGNNISGQYKRGVGMAFQIGIGHFGGAMAANIYRTQDKPRFLVGHGCELMFAGIGLICVPITALALARINKKRDEATRAALERGEKNHHSYKVLRAMGDRAPDFRYTL
ncbi:MFS general substrate transporter [Mycena rebaudengoi]|nr:MFS general substrate transporter [Mycena rebaudengoi]